MTKEEMRTVKDIEERLDLVQYQFLRLLNQLHDLAVELSGINWNIHQLIHSDIETYKKVLDEEREEEKKEESDEEVPY